MENKLINNFIVNNTYEVLSKWGEIVTVKNDQLTYLLYFIFIIFIIFIIFLLQYYFMDFVMLFLFYYLQYLFSLLIIVKICYTNIKIMIRI